LGSKGLPLFLYIGLINQYHIVLFLQLVDRNFTSSVVWFSYYRKQLQKYTKDDKHGQI